ncbi:molecular chaperone TorD family protein [Campylobacter sp. JMF_07 ED4]|uniref:molecular chaperone TorD family protein n=1 Tax=unclassified Campylobacter TaxID=2593542 RepID=UPI0022E9EB41|nr:MULTISPECIES: molecular chaperone TorD family protein [unclassified Campylobacter]MDA3043213.1 molecular chaperone TorD family protein [Campylobacter sp. JMF_09 ED2]MDA3045098.1 molecular chaperone TorD family protein [Campylobacter sp. JMF_07 ED4]MDA3064302.1 molecular chaperone TorD family protein [Campylobacter sp. JMF_11 EL3]MDA3071881.1 molecular chaperone TorD family protein [Campylobacter sp. VBCF_03 NA9]
MKNNQISIDCLDLCADLLAFPAEGWREKYCALGEFANGEFAERFNKFSNFKFNDLKTPNLDEIISNYIFYFDLNSAKFGTSLLAGVWLDKKMFGESYNEICKFYEICGFVVEKNCDHASNLLAFCAILAEQGEWEKFLKFTKFLDFLEPLSKNLANFENLKEFEFILNFAKFLISNLKEQR